MSNVRPDLITASLLEPILTIPANTPHKKKLPVTYKESIALNVYSGVLICPFIFLPENPCVFVLSGKKVNGQIRTPLYFIQNYSFSVYK